MYLPVPLKYGEGIFENFCRDPRFTKPLLYQLSYAGNTRHYTQKITLANGGEIHFLVYPF